MTTEFQRLRVVEDLVQNRFDADQVAHRILDACLRVEVEDSFTGYLLELRSNGGEGFTDFGRQEGAELADRGLTFLFPNNGFGRGGHRRLEARCSDVGRRGRSGSLRRR